MRDQRSSLPAICALAAIFGSASSVVAQQALPSVIVEPPKPRPALAPALQRPRAAERPRRARPASRAAQAGTAHNAAPSRSAVAPAVASSSAPGILPTDAPPAAASEQIYTSAQINSRPVTRPGETLEFVPGLIVTQHSGEGKANQYMLRGFQLDHGTDFAVTLDGMPLNMPTHGHGQGYLDTNFLMPELLGPARVRKGPYYADEGDFSSAGSVRLNYVDRLDKGIWSLTAGSFGYGRLFGAKSYGLGTGTLLAAAEAGVYNGPWRRPDDMRKINAFVRWSEGTQDNGLSLTGMAYANRWYSTDQIPARAVDQGLIPLTGTLNPDDGGNTSRFSLSGRWSRSDAQSATRVEAYAIHSTLNLYNDFTYFLANPVLGDQFRQFDRRTILGLNATQAYRYDVAGLPVETRFGLQSRYDAIRVGLQNDFQRQVYSTVRNDAVQQGSIGLWTDTTVRWTPWLRTTAGLRLDYYNVRVNSLAQPFDAVFYTGALNNGAARAAMASPKAGVVLGPWMDTEFFVNAGRGFHSNDARGVFARIDPNDGSNLQPSSLLVRSQGAEVGVRTRLVPGLESSLALFWLDSAAENLFAGDAGGTEVGRASRRVGIELTNHYHPVSWLRIDGDLAITRARFRGNDFWQQYPNWLALAGYPEAQIGNAPGNLIPEAPNLIASLGIQLGEDKGWFGGARLRYIGPRALTEDGAFRSPSTALLNARVGYRFDNGVRIQLEGFNLTNSRSDQITYAYGSFLRTDALFAACQAGVPPAEVCATGVMNRVLHPVEPLALRLSIAGNF